MRDLYKGSVLLLLAFIASLVTLSAEDRHWKLPFAKYYVDPDSYLHPNSDVAAIQAQLFAGLDPTVNAAPTATGKSKTKTRALASVCFKGNIARDKSSDLFHGAAYVSIKETDDTFIEVNETDFLIKNAFAIQSASIVSALPAPMQNRLDSALESGRCATLDLYLSKISN
ncbi:MAG: hypothetical protein V7784_18480 [Oceanospirillaceae bacterium]